MKLSIVMPAYNESLALKEIIERVIRVKLEKELIIVDDGSTDGTVEILKRYKHDSIKVVFHPYNMGKGCCIKTGLKYVTGDVVIIQDADLEYNPEEYPELIKPILEGKAKVVYGSRWLDPSKHPPIPKSYFTFGRWLLTKITNLLYNANITDESTCYKVFDAKLIRSIKLECKGFEFCPEVTAKIRKLGYHIHEVPISYSPRSIKEGKKISWKDGLLAIWTLIKYRFVD